MALTKAQFADKRRRRRSRGWRALMIMIGLTAIGAWGLAVWRGADSLPMTGIASEFDPAFSLEQLLREHDVPATVTTVSEFNHQGPREEWRSLTLEVSLNGKRNEFNEVMAAWRQRIRSRSALAGITPPAAGRNTAEEIYSGWTRSHKAARHC